MIYLQIKICKLQLTQQRRDRVAKKLRFAALRYTYT